MERKDRIDAFGVAALTIVSPMLAGNQVLVKLTNAGLQLACAGRAGRTRYSGALILVAGGIVMINRPRPDATVPL